MDLLLRQQLTDEMTEQLGELFRACFGAPDLLTRRGVSRHALLREGGTIVAHAAAAERRLDLRSEEIALAVLGMVCVAPSHRGRRLGHRVVQALHAALRMPFILNCGHSLVPYYAGIGYRKISSAASYLRDGEIVVDSDPVLLFPNGHRISTAMRDEPIHFGTDF